jgi:transcriptional regulator with XRE-family HTH domain
MRQKELAYKAGVDPSYLSAMLSGRKGRPSDTILRKIQDGLGLSPEDRAKLNDAVKYSQIRYEMPAEADPFEYEIVWLLMMLICSRR